MNSNLIIFNEEYYRVHIKDVVRLAREEIHNEYKELVKVSDWISEKEAMSLLHISSTSTLQKFRNENRIVFSYVTNKNIVYSRTSIMEYIDKQSNRNYV